MFYSNHSLNIQNEQQTLPAYYRQRTKQKSFKSSPNATVWCFKHFHRDIIVIKFSVKFQNSQEKCLQKSISSSSTENQSMKKKCERRKKTKWRAPLIGQAGRLLYAINFLSLFFFSLAWLGLVCFNTTRFRQPLWRMNLAGVFLPKYE